MSNEVTEKSRNTFIRLKFHVLIDFRALYIFSNSSFPMRTDCSNGEWGLRLCLLAFKQQEHIELKRNVLERTKKA